MAATKRKAHVVADVVAHAPTKSGADAQTLVGTVALANAVSNVASVAGTDGDVGPNLDEDAYDRERVLDAIANGGRGSGAMAEDLLVGAEAEQVAELIAGDEPLR